MSNLARSVFASRTTGSGNGYEPVPLTSTSAPSASQPNINEKAPAARSAPDHDDEDDDAGRGAEDSSLLEKGWGANKTDRSAGDDDDELSPRRGSAANRLVSLASIVTSLGHSIIHRSNNAASGSGPGAARRRRKLAVLTLGLVALVVTAIVYAILACGVVESPPLLEPPIGVETTESAGDAESTWIEPSSDAAINSDMDVEDAALYESLAQSIDTATHRIFRAVEDSADRRIQLRPTRFLPDDCLDLWFTHGQVCNSTDTLPLGPEEQLDIVYLWVNGSDPLWQQERTAKAEDALAHKSPSGIIVHDSSSDKHYRDIGGFEYNLRSAVDSFKRLGEDDEALSKIRKIHVLSADFPAAIDSAASFQIGQVPSWLVDDDVDDEKFAEPELQWHFHSEVFRSGLELDDISNDLECSSEEEWRSVALPTFNSFAIESRLAWLDDLGDAAVQSNDDMYFLGSLAASDFHSPLYGSVFRLDNSPGLMVKPILQTTKIWDSGEWGGLQHANWLLSRRFPSRTRQYINHVPKTLSKPILDEVSIMFARDIATAAARPFRESRHGQGDIEFAFLITHMRIERWREALLWTWAVAKMGHREGGMWGPEARKELAQVLGMENLTQEEVVEVKKSERQTLRDVPSSFEEAGWEEPQATTYSFCSMDGHLPVMSTKMVKKPNGKQYKINVAEDKCSIDLGQCFAEFINGVDVSAEDMFKRLTFTEWRCGDCLIDALVGASGDKGLAAFLPDTDAKFSSVTTSDSDQPAHLPLVDDWTKADFSLAAVVQSESDVYLRTWTQQLLSRYLYISGDSEAQFSQIHTPYEAAGAVTHLDATRSIKLACLNDDFLERHAASTATVLIQWMTARWADVKPWWEK